jgi:hypothetical protein
LSNIYIFSSYIQDELLSHLNLIYNRPHLYSNGDDYFLFIRPNSLNINIKFNYDLFVTEDDFNNVSLNIPETFSNTISFLASLKQFKIYFRLPINTTYLIQQHIILKIISSSNIIEYSDLNLNKFNNIDQDELLSLLKYEKIKSFDKREFFKLYFIEDEIRKRLFSRVITNTFYQKSIEKNKVDLLFLFIDFYLRDLSSMINIKILDTNNISHYGYRFVHFSEQLDVHPRNMHIHLDNFDEPELFPSGFSFLKDITDSSIINLNNKKYFFDVENLINTKVLSANKKLSDLFFHLYDIYNDVEILYKLLEFYELVDFNFTDEIIYYKPINYSFNIVSYFDDLLSFDHNSAISLINDFPLKFKESYKINIKPVGKCPYCIDGFIFDNFKSFFCNSCDFNFVRIAFKNKYNIDISKREFKILLVRKNVILNYNGVFRTFFLVKNGKWTNLVLTRN